MLKFVEFLMSLSECRQSLDLAARLGDQWAWKYILQIWSWAWKHAEDGTVSGTSCVEAVERVAGWEGRPGELWRHLMDAGWISRIGKERFELNFWAEHIAPIIARRDKDRRRANDRYHNDISFLRGESTESPQSLRRSSVEGIDKGSSSGALLDLPFGPSVIAPSAPHPLTAGSKTTVTRAKSRAQLAYELFRTRRNARTAAPDEPMAVKEVAKRVGDVINAIGDLAWGHVVTAYLADEDFPKACTPPWPLRALLKTYARYCPTSAPTAKKAEVLSIEEQVLKAAVMEVYATARSAPYPWQAADAEALRECLKFAAGDEALLVERWERALGLERWPQCNSLRQLARQWADVDRVVREAETRVSELRLVRSE